MTFTYVIMIAGFLLGLDAYQNNAEEMRVSPCRVCVMKEMACKDENSLKGVGMTGLRAPLETLHVRTIAISNRANSKTLPISPRSGYNMYSAG